ncbi:hypothetical protein EBZ39_08360 [bacterium]|nr:hypothetical protein [bacterium]
MDFIQYRHQLVRLQAALIDIIGSLDDESLEKSIVALLMMLQDRIESITPPRETSSPCPCGRCDAE